jgi:hypothetical protein
MPIELWHCNLRLHVEPGITLIYQGTNPVAAYVVFKDGKPAKKLCVCCGCSGFSSYGVVYLSPLQDF